MVLNLDVSACGGSGQSPPINSTVPATEAPFLVR